MRVVITGGAGFIGCNLAQRLASSGHRVSVLDSLVRAGSERNLQHLLASAGHAWPIDFHQIDIRDVAGVASVFPEGDVVDAVVHLAAQTTVTESVANPVEDFAVNAAGTLNLLEAVRLRAPSAQVVFASTNKVYGDLRRLRFERDGDRYVLPDFPDGIAETFPTDAAGPYGCSKLAADSYMRDYARTFGLHTTVLRTSCVYGRWQNGMLGQGWVAWFSRAALRGEGVTVYGDGLQVRDLLHVDDLVDAYVAILNGPKGTGEAYNVGGGPRFGLSIWAEFGRLLEGLVGHRIPVRYEDRRVADQAVFLTDHRKLSAAFGWQPRRAPRDGVADLLAWLAERPAEEVARS